MKVLENGNLQGSYISFIGDSAEVLKKFSIADKVLGQFSNFGEKRKRTFERFRRLSISL